MAPVAAHLLLSRKAPAFLVKGIPDKVTYGSHTWVTFSVAVARLEARASGSTSRMNFSEVMKLADEAPLTPQDRQVEKMAQRDALKDWGVANGVLLVNTQDDYTADQMSVVFMKFNAQIRELSEASSALSAPVPTRRAMAIEMLKGVYGHDAPVEDERIYVNPPKADYPGPYSLVDLYMKGYLHKKPDDVFGWWSGDDRVKPKTNTYGLPNINDQFDTAIQKYFLATEKGIAAQVKNLIATLPLADRKNIEQGKITPLSETTYIRYTRALHAPLRSTTTKKTHVLLVKTELNGVKNIYEIDLKENRVRKRNELKDHPVGDMVYTEGHTVTGRALKEVEPDGTYLRGVTDEKHQEGTPNNFFSEKTRYIANAMAKHSGIRELEAEARGQTTFDTEVPTYKKVQEFLLNLIPLRSAINNFIKGNTAAGVTDVLFDALGFVVGLGAAARGAKVLSAGASTLARAGSVLRTVGRAAIGSLNPLDGAADLVRGIGALGKAGFNQGQKAFRTLTNAADSYDLVNASKRFDASSAGTFKLNNDVVEGPAVLQNGRWHHYDPITRSAYGPALTDFVPSAKLNSEDLGKWATEKDITTKVDPTVVTQWKKTVNTHRDGPEKNSFERGYSSGEDPETISGFSHSMKIPDLMKLVADKKNLTAEQVGMVVKRYDDLIYDLSRSGSARFIDNIEPRFGEVIPMPQIVYISQTAQLSDGQCAALSYVMASAMAEGKEKILIKNMLTAAAFPRDPASRSFIEGLSKIHTRVRAPTAFSAGQTVRQLSVKNVVDELANSTVSKSVMIATPDHAMTAGVKIEGASKSYFFYEPNFGLANFKSADAMEKALEKLTHDKKLFPQYKTYSTDSSKLEFQVVDHTNDWKKKNDVFDFQVKPLYDAPLAVKSTSTTTSPALPAPVTPQVERIDVPISDFATTTDGRSVLSTRGLSDCTAIAVLTDFRDGIYHKRTLMHFQGGVPSDEMYTTLKQLDADLANGGKVIFLGGDLTKSPVGIGVALGQSHNEQKVLLDIVKKHPESTTIGTASGIDINPDGSYKLIEGNNNVPTVFDQNQRAQVFDMADD